MKRAALRRWSCLFVLIACICGETDLSFWINKIIFGELEAGEVKQKLTKSQRRCIFAPAAEHEYF